MPLQRNTPALPRILVELVLGAICLFTLPLSFDWLSKAIHGQGGSGRLVGVLIASIIGVLLLVDAYRMMRQRSTAPTHHPDENTGSSAL